MQNILLFLASCALVGGFTRWFSSLGQSALTAWIAFLSLLANLFVLKEIQLFGLNATASDVFAIGSLFSLNLLREKYGFQQTQQAIWISFSCLLFFVIISQIHLFYVPSPYDASHASYAFLLGSSPRLLLASLVTFLIADQFDARFYSFLRRKYPHRSLLFLMGLSISVTQILDTLLFSFLGLYGLIHALAEIMLISYGIKLLAIINTLPWPFITQRLFQKNAPKSI